MIFYGGPFHEGPYTDLRDLNLDYILKHICDLLKDSEDFKRHFGANDEDIKKLKDWINACNEGNIPEALTRGILTWAQVHMPDLIAKCIKNVFFGLDERGYFVAYIPDSWEDITFETTGKDVDLELMPEYGHLLLSY